MLQQPFVHSNAYQHSFVPNILLMIDMCGTFSQKLSLIYPSNILRAVLIITYLHTLKLLIVYMLNTHSLTLLHLPFWVHYIVSVYCYICASFAFCITFYTHQKKRVTDLIIPCISVLYLLMQNLSFFVNIPFTWNQLPSYLLCLLCPVTFRDHLSSHLCSNIEHLFCFCNPFCFLFFSAYVYLLCGAHLPSVHTCYT